MARELGTVLTCLNPVLLLHSFRLAQGELVGVRGMFGGNGSHMLTPDQAPLALPPRPSGPSSLVQPRAAACLLRRPESFGAARFAFLYRCAAWITGD